MFSEGSIFGRLEVIRERVKIIKSRHKSNYKGELELNRLLLSLSIKSPRSRFVRPIWIPAASLAAISASSGTLQHSLGSSQHSSGTPSVEWGRLQHSSGSSTPQARRAWSGSWLQSLSVCGQSSWIFLGSVLYLDLMLVQCDVHNESFWARVRSRICHRV